MAGFLNGGDSRLPLIDRAQAGMLVRSLYPADGDASNITKALAGSPDTLSAMAPFLSQVMNATTIEVAERLLAEGFRFITLSSDVRAMVMK